jgi:dTMP kinase
VATLPLVHTLPFLFLANLVLEGLTLLWTPAKEATVPNLVPKEELARANSLGLAAAYGTFPIGAALFTALAGLATYLSRYDPLTALKVNQENLAIWTDTATFLLSAALISTIAMPRRAREPSEHRIDLGQHAREVREGWSFIGRNPVVRAVLIALACGLFGGGMVVPLGPVVAKDVLGGGPRSFGSLITALGMGVAIGVLAISSVQKRFAPQRVFVRAVVLCGVALVAAASMWDLTPALILVGVMGVGAGAVYVLGFALIQEHTEDELRGRTFAALYAIVRLCLVLSFVVGPLVASLTGNLSNRFLHGHVHVGPWTVHLPGARIALWLGGLVIVGAGFLGRRAMRSPRATPASTSA